MTLSKNNWFARYYNWIYGNYPKDVCSFFWGSLYALVVFFFVVPGRLALNEDDRHSPVAQFFTGLALVIMTLVVIAAGNGILDKFGYQFINLWGVIFGGLAIGLILCAAIVGIFYLIYLIVAGLGKTSRVVSEASFVQNTSDFVGAIRRKHCTKITMK